MRIDTYVQALREDLARVAAAGDETTARVAQLLAGALESAFARRLQEALTEAAMELSPQIEDGHIEVRIAATDPQLIFVAAQPQTETAPGANAAEEALSARMTLRLPEGLKGRIEAAALDAGVSVNTWILRALKRAVDRHGCRSASRHRLVGYGRS